MRPKKKPATGQKPLVHAPDPDQMGISSTRSALSSIVLWAASPATGTIVTAPPTTHMGMVTSRVRTHPLKQENIRTQISIMAVFLIISPSIVWVIIIYNIFLSEKRPHGKLRRT